MESKPVSPFFICTEKILRPPYSIHDCTFICTLGGREYCTYIRSTRLYIWIHGGASTQSHGVSTPSSTSLFLSVLKDLHLLVSIVRRSYNTARLYPVLCCTFSVMPLLPKLSPKGHPFVALRTCRISRLMKPFVKIEAPQIAIIGGL